MLDQITQAVVIGTITGAVYGLVALGIVLVYKSSGVFNFAQGEFGTIGVYATFAAVKFWHLPYAVGVLVGLAASVAAGLLTERLVIRPLFDAARVTLLVATAGVALLAIGVEFWRSGDVQLRVLPPISTELQRVKVFGVSVSDQRLVILAVLVVVAVGLALFFNRTTLGLAVLGASQEPVASELVGISVRRISALTWGLAAFVGGLAGILSAPISQFAPGFLTSGALIAGFTAAVLGGMTSLPGAFVGGIVVGVAQALSTLDVFGDLPGAGAVIVFGLLLAVLLVRPQGLFGGRAA